MSQFQLVASGNFTSDGSAKNIPLRSDFDYFEVENHTQMATTQATGRGVFFRWYKGYAANSAFMVSKENAANTVTYEVITTAGFTRIDQSNQAPEAAQATSGTDVSVANPAVVTVTSHGYSNGDRIRIYGTTSMLQIAGMDFTIGNVNTNDFELSYMDTSDAAIFSAATAGFVRRIPNNPIYFPQKNFITNVTSSGTSSVVTLSVTHGLSVGAIVGFRVTSDNGMSELNNLEGTVTAVSTANNTITVDIDSSTFTAFAFPTSAVAALGYTQAHIVPVGETASVLANAFDNTAQIIMQLGAGADGPAGSNNDAIYWRAFKSGFVNNEI